MNIHFLFFFSTNGYSKKKNYFSANEFQRIMTKEFSYTFNELDITEADVFELMGFELDLAPEPFPEILQVALEKAKKICRPTGGFSIFGECGVNTTDKIISIETQQFHPDKIIVTQLKSAQQIAIFVCTAGNAITDLANEMMTGGDIILGYALDTIGSVVADRTALKIQQELENNSFQKGLKISDRFSPGYCDWDVAEQHKLFSLLPPGFCGVTLSASALMCPAKSVSGIIGIGKNLRQKGYQCHWCTDKDCFVGKINRMKKDEKKVNKSVV